MKTLLTVITATLLLASCGKKETKFDGSCNAAAENSIERMTVGMDEARKKRFTEAYAALALKYVATDIDDTDAAVENFRKDLDGKTADEIIELGEKVGPDDL